MSVVTVGFKAFGVGYDHRWKHWAKFASADCIDLAKANGYALTGSFLREGESVSLGAGQYIVLASQTGSARYMAYEYGLVGLNEEGVAVRIEDTAINTLLDDAHLPDAIEAKRRNSDLYRYAAYIWATAQLGEAGHAPAHVNTSPLETIWETIRALPEGDQVELRNRLLQAL